MIKRKRYHIIRIVGWWTSKFNWVEFRSLGIQIEVDVAWKFWNKFFSFFVIYFFWVKLRWKRKLHGIWPVEHWLKTATTLSLLLPSSSIFFMTTDNNRDDELLVCSERFLFSFIAFRLLCSLDSLDVSSTLYFRYFHRMIINITSNKIFLFFYRSKKR